MPASHAHIGAVIRLGLAHHVSDVVMDTTVWTKTEVLEALRVVAATMGFTVPEALSRLQNGRLYTQGFADQMRKLVRLLAAVGGGDADLHREFVDDSRACRLCGQLPSIDPRVPVSRLKPACGCWRGLIDKLDAS